MGDASFVNIGYIQKTHGIHGELLVNFDLPLKFDPIELESVFIEIDGIPVPFFIENIKAPSEEKAILKLDEVDSIEKAQHFTGLNLLLPLENIPESDEMLLADLVGYSVYDENGNCIGKISDYIEYDLNATFTVLRDNGVEVIIPAADELITLVDTEKKIVEMQVPDGLLNLNS